MEIDFSLKVGSDPRDSETLKKRPPQGSAWVDCRLTKTQVTSRPETIWPGVWSSVPKCDQQKAKQQWDSDKPKIQSARHKRENHDILLAKLKNLTHFSERQKWHITVEPAMPCVARKRIPTAKTHTESCSVKSRRRGPQALSEGRLSLSQREKDK